MTSKKSEIICWRVSLEERKILKKDSQRVGFNNISQYIRDSIFGSKEYTLKEYSTLMRNLRESITLMNKVLQTELKPESNTIRLQNLHLPGPPNSLPQRIVSEDEWVVAKREHKQLSIPTAIQGQGTSHSKKIISEVKNLIKSGRIKKII